jgi:uncharacterized protein (DUF433 family)
MATGTTEAELLLDFPQLCHEDVLACLAFAAERERRLLIPIFHNKYSTKPYHQ